MIDVGAGFDAWRASLRKRARQQFTRAERFGVSVRRGDAGADLERVHELHAEQARHWGVRTVRPLAFYRALLEPPTSAVLWVGEAEGRVECGVLAFVEPHETYVWWSGASIVHGFWPV